MSSESAAPQVGTDTEGESKTGKRDYEEAVGAPSSDTTTEGKGASNDKVEAAGSSSSTTTTTTSERVAEPSSKRQKVEGEGEGEGDAEVKEAQVKTDSGSPPVTKTAGGTGTDNKGSAQPARPPAVFGPSNYSELARQIEYYLSDRNLSSDAFFQEQIRKDPEGWISVDQFLACPKVKAMNCTVADIPKALKECKSHLEVKEGQTHIRREGNKELPVLVTRQEARKKMKPSTDPHVGGCLVWARNLPSEINPLTVKDKLNATLLPLLSPDAAGTMKNRPVLYTGAIENGSCLAAVRPFVNDRSLFEKTLTLDINGCEVIVSLADGAKDDLKIRALLNNLTRQMKRQRAKDVETQKNVLAKRPVVLDGVPFKSIDHLRQCLKELLENTKADTEFAVGTNSYKVLKAVLAFHPKAAEKMRGLTGVKVGYHKPSADGGGTPSGQTSTEKNKSFCVIRDGGLEPEDFSYVKCIANLIKNPPPVPTEQPTDSPAPSSTLVGSEQGKEASKEASEKTKAESEGQKGKGNEGTSASPSTETKEKDEKEEDKSASSAEEKKAV